MDSAKRRMPTTSSPCVVFVSSTILDLESARRELRALLEAEAPIPVRSFLSEEPDFPVPPRLIGRDPFEIALENIRGADFVIQLIGARYGATGTFDGEEISITHAEYREAFRRRIPIYTLVRENVWTTYLSQVPAPGIDAAVFDLLDEIQGSQRRKWIFAWQDFTDIATTIRESFFAHDESSFVADITIPDGTVVECGEIFEKVWEVRNIGFVTWRDRSLACINPSLPLRPLTDHVPIPVTIPGEAARLAVHFTAPQYPGAYHSEWKMTDERGRVCLPWMKGLMCEVSVRYWRD